MIDLRAGFAAALIASPAAASPLIGTWSGGRTTLVLTAQGGELIEDCATTLITARVQRDRRGDFIIVAQRRQDPPGPQRLDESDKPVAPDSATVRYRGSTIGHNLELARDAESGVAPTRLVPGKSVKRIRCL